VRLFRINCIDIKHISAKGKRIPSEAIFAETFSQSFAFTWGNVFVEVMYLAKAVVSTPHSIINATNFSICSTS